MTQPVNSDALVLGRYALLELLARGGMGSIYLARTEGAAGFRKPVVVKLIHPHLMDDPAAVKSFVREAKLAARLVHPNIVQVMDFGEHANQYLTVLEYVHGYDLGVLSQYLADRGRKFSIPHGSYIIWRLLRALDFAHNLQDDDGENLGLVHRDISPHNVLISDDGQVKLTDFGVARIKKEASQTGGNKLTGKLAYLAPEQVSGGKTDHRSDLFAVGIVFFEVLTGQRLFAAEHEAQTIMRISRADVPDIRQIRPDVPPKTSQILARALAQKPEQRYQAASDFAADVRELFGVLSPDEIEPSFREIIVSTVSEPGFSAIAGHLPDVTRVLRDTPLPIASSPIQRPETPRPKKKKKKKRLPLKYLIVLALAIMILASSTVYAVLYIVGDTNRNRTRPQVAMIINNQEQDGSTKIQPDGGTTGQNMSDSQSVKSGNDAGAGRTKGTKGTKGTKNTKGQSPRTLNGRIVTRTLMRKRGQIRRCFTTHGDASAETVNISIRVEITRDGSVRGASVSPALIQSSPLGQCIVSVARSTRFPRHSEDVVAFRVPMRLQR